MNVLSKKMEIQGFFLNIIGIMMVLGSFIYFVDAALEIPVMELNPNGKCLRVLDKKGENISDGCNLVRQRKITAEHRYVAE
jgi:hypothetical protein